MRLFGGVSSVRPTVRRILAARSLSLRTPRRNAARRAGGWRGGRGSPDDVLSNLPTPGVYNEEGIRFFSCVLMPLFEWGLSYPLISPCPHRKRICPQTFAGTLPSFLGGPKQREKHERQKNGTFDTKIAKKLEGKSFARKIPS